MDNEKLKKLIECCHLNFLIGSGASRPFLGTLGTIEQLLTELSVDTHLSADDRLIIECSIKKHYFDVAIRGNLNLKAGGSKLETTNANYSAFYVAIHALLLKRQTNLISRQANIFTTNMDLFNEHALETGGFTYNDGFSGRMHPNFGTENFGDSIRQTSLHFEYQSELPLFNLFKLHGSVNWIMTPDASISYDSQLKLLNDVKEVKSVPSDLLDIEYEEKLPTGKTVWHSHDLAGLKNQLSVKKISIKPNHEQFIIAYNKLAMINPTKEKFETTTKKLIFYELLRMYANNLEKENSILFVFGFSFADEHLREITVRAAKSNPTLLIVIFAFDTKAKESMEKLLPGKNNIVILTGTGNYSLDVVNKVYFQAIAESLSTSIK